MRGLWTGGRIALILSLVLPLLPSVGSPPIGAASGLSPSFQNQALNTPLLSARNATQPSAFASRLTIGMALFAALSIPPELLSQKTPSPSRKSAAAKTLPVPTYEKLIGELSTALSAARESASQRENLRAALWDGWTGRMMAVPRSLPEPALRSALEAAVIVATPKALAAWPADLRDAIDNFRNAFMKAREDREALERLIGRAIEAASSMPRARTKAQTILFQTFRSLIEGAAADETSSEPAEPFMVRALSGGADSSRLAAAINELGVLRNSSGGFDVQIQETLVGIRPDQRDRILIEVRRGRQAPVGRNDSFNGARTIVSGIDLASTVSRIWPAAPEWPADPPPADPKNAAVLAALEELAPWMAPWPAPRAGEKLLEMQQGFSVREPSAHLRLTAAILPALAPLAGISRETAILVEREFLLQVAMNVASALEQDYAERFDALMPRLKTLSAHPEILRDYEKTLLKDRRQSPIERWGSVLIDWIARQLTPGVPQALLDRPEPVGALWAFGLPLGLLPWIRKRTADSGYTRLRFSETSELPSDFLSFWRKVVWGTPWRSARYWIADFSFLHDIGPRIYHALRDSDGRLIGARMARAHTWTPPEDSKLPPVKAFYHGWAAVETPGKGVGSAFTRESGQALLTRLPEDGGIRYAYVDAKNHRSWKNLKNQGYEKMGRFEVNLVSWRHPIEHANVIPAYETGLSAEELARQIRERFSDHLLLDIEDSIEWDHTWALVEGSEVIATVYAKPDHWRFLSLGLFPGDQILLPIMTWLSNRWAIVPSADFKFLKFGNVYYKPGRADAASLLLQTLLARHGLRQGMLYLDPKSPARHELEQAGIFSPLNFKLKTAVDIWVSMDSMKQFRKIPLRSLFSQYPFWISVLNNNMWWILGVIGLSMIQEFPAEGSAAMSLPFFDLLVDAFKPRPSLPRNIALSA